MAKTIEQLDEEYQGREEDRHYLDLQAVLGTQADADAAYDEEGNFHCIHWFDCSYCPAFNAAHCL